MTTSEASVASGADIALEVSGLRTILRTGGTEQYPVDGVSFELRRGETLAIVGESGSGKSMTALSIIGLLPRIASVVGGSAVLAGEDLLALNPKAMRDQRGVSIAYMPQDPVSALNPSLTIGRQVTEPLVIHRQASRQEATERAVELLRMLGIPNLPAALDAYPHQLSGGMRQRVLLAMSLIGRPRVLIADEPTTSVDVTTQEQIIDLLGDIQRDSSLALIIITHDLGVVARIATRVLVMYAGSGSRVRRRRRGLRSADAPLHESLVALRGFRRRSPPGRASTPSKAIHPSSATCRAVAHSTPAVATASTSAASSCPNSAPCPTAGR